MLFFVYDLLILINIPFEKHIFLSMNEILKFPRLSYGITRFFKPLLIGFKIILHFFGAHLHGFLNKFLVFYMVLVIH